MPKNNPKEPKRQPKYRVPEDESEEEEDSEAEELRSVLPARMLKTPVFSNFYCFLIFLKGASREETRIT